MLLFLPIYLLGYCLGHQDKSGHVLHPHVDIANCDTQDTPDMNPREFKKEFERPLSQAEREAIVKGYEAYVPKEKILTLLDEC